MTYGVVTKGRVARTVHRCGCGTVILPGDPYLTMVAFPGSEVGNTHFERLPECAPCAYRYRRDHLLPFVSDMRTALMVACDSELGLRA